MFRDITIGQYIDIPSAIDYYIHTVDEAAADATDKNYILVTFDRVKWYFSAYDRDTTYGLDWDGKMFFAPNVSTTYKDYANLHSLMKLIYSYKAEELKARSISMHNGVKSEANVANEFTNFVAGIPSQILDEDARKWPTIPATTASSTWQIINWYRLRREYLDKEIENLESVPVIPNNLFTLGNDGTDWCNAAGVVSDAGMPNLTKYPGAAYAFDAAGRTTVSYRNIMYQNNGGAYTFGATFTAETAGLECKPRKLVQLFDTEGNVLTSGCSAGAYMDFYRGYYLDGAETTFTLSEEVASFKVGFLWTIEPCTPGEGVIISNIYLLSK